MLILKGFYEYSGPFSQKTAREVFTIAVGRVMSDGFSPDYRFEYWLPETVFKEVSDMYPALITKETDTSYFFAGVYTKIAEADQGTWSISTWLTANPTETTDDLEVM